jgi:hypothetical protein
MIETEGKQREYLNEWSLCCSLMVLKLGGHDQSVYLQLQTQASCIKLLITLKQKVG